MSPEQQTAIARPAPRLRRRLPWRAPAVAKFTSATDARGIDEQRLTRDIAGRESVYRRLLAVADLFGAAVALAIAVQWLGDDILRWQIVTALPVVVVVAKLQGLYDRDALVLNKTTLDEAPALFSAATLYALLFVIAQEWFIQGHLGASQLLALWLIFFATAVVGRWGARRLANHSVDLERVLVLGGPLEAQRVRDKLAANPSVHAEVVGRVDLAGSGNGSSGSISDLERIVKDLGVHRAIVAPGETSYDQTLDGIRAAKAVGVQVSVLPRLLEVVGSSVEFDQLFGMSVLGIRRFGLTTSSRAVKRGMDVAGACVGLALLAPLLAALAVLVRLSSPGPMLFRQQRVGQDGMPFVMFKFRTMYEHAEHVRAELMHRNEAADGLFKISDDPRVTPIGRFLRRTSLDELPQLINVLLGEMSLVGPRPLVPEEDSRIEGGHRRRLHLKPGMTGHWQIFGSSRIPIREMVTIDYLYAANWSLWGDVKILFRTVPYVLAQRGQ